VLNAADEEGDWIMLKPEWQVKAQAGLDAKKKDTGGAGNSYRIRLG
jgi:hypothetical protein